VFERSGGKKRTRWPSAEGGFFWSGFSSGFILRYYVFTPVKLLKDQIMSVATLVGSFDDVVRSASVLAEGIEGGLCFDSLFVECQSSCLQVSLSDSHQFLFLPRIYQIRITTRRMPKEMARCRERSCSTETRHRENQGTVLRSKLTISLDISNKFITTRDRMSTVL